MRTARKIRYRLEWMGLKSATKFVPLLSRKACYRLALLLGSLGAMFDRRGRRVALSNLRVAFGDELSSARRAQIVRESYQHFLGLRRSRRCGHRAAIQESAARSDLLEVAPEKRPSRGTAQRRRHASLPRPASRRTLRLARRSDNFGETADRGD